MYQIKIITPDPIAQTLLSHLAAQLPEQKENLILLDISRMDGLQEFAGRKVILFTPSSDPVYLTKARESGAAGFWYLEPSLDSLQQVLSGARPFPEKAPAVQLGRISSDAVTERELEVLRELVAGKTDPEIARTMSLAIPTVKHHIQQLREKTGLANRTQLAVAAVSAGLICKK